MSSTEAKFTVRAKECTSEVWLRKVMRELNICQNATKSDQDDRGAIVVSEDGPARHFSKRKHVDIKLSHVVELIKREEIKLNKVGRSEVIADCLTKPISPEKPAGAADRAGIFWGK